MPDQAETMSADPTIPRVRISTAVAFAFAACALLVVAWFVYRPGTAGVFLLDDFSNLSALGKSGPVTTWDAFWRYVTSGTADPTGRPLSLLSFLLDARDWPTAAGPFKATNILFHLLNAVLLCWAMLKLGQRRLPASRAAMAALAGAGIWTLHPLFVSTVLYVVQREAMLPATFTFIGIICWCSGRNAFDHDRPLRGIAWMAAGAWLCTLLASLSKANGILLPLLLAVAEVTVLRATIVDKRRYRRVRRAASITLLGLPIALLVAYLALALPGLITTTPAIRGWTVGQRLLSEPRIIIEYLYLLWVPHTTSFGVFNDQVHASMGWFAPWTTLPCMVLVLGLILMGWLVRRRYPAVAFAILFYFAGQLLESSFIPLELAFEHRNYLPAAFMFWPIGLWLAKPKVRPMIGPAVAILAMCVLAVMTWTRAGVWGNPQLQARLWGRINPDSPQAQSFSAQVEAASGNSPKAIARLRNAAIRMPGEPQVALTLVGMECKAGSVSPQSWRLAMRALADTHDGWNNIANWLVTTTSDVTRHGCQGLTTTQLEHALQIVESNPNVPELPQYKLAFRRASAVIHMANRQPRQALADFDAVLAGNPVPRVALEQARSLAAFGYRQPALEHLNYYTTLPPHSVQGMGMQRIHAWVLRKQGWWQGQLSAYRKQLEQSAHSGLAD